MTGRRVEALGVFGPRHARCGAARGLTVGAPPHGAEPRAPDRWSCSTPARRSTINSSGAAGCVSAWASNREVGGHHDRAPDLQHPGRLRRVHPHRRHAGPRPDARRLSEKPAAGGVSRPVRREQSADRAHDTVLRRPDDHRPRRLAMVRVQPVERTPPAAGVPCVHRGVDVLTFATHLPTNARLAARTAPLDRVPASWTGG